MARPQKNNADYFPHDAGMRNDPKIRALRARYGLEAYAVWCIMLETLTDADNFTITWDELNIELIAGDIGISPEQLTQIVDYMQRVQLIQIHSDTRQIHTPRHHERMLPIIEARERKRQWKQENNPKATTKIPAQGISDGENPQSKVKETKLNKTKQEREENAPAPDQIENQKTENHHHPATIDQIYTLIEKHCDTDTGLHELIHWKKTTGYSDRIHGPTTGEVTKFISHYLQAMRATDPVQYFRDHFAAWLVRATEYNRPKAERLTPSHRGRGPGGEVTPRRTRTPNATDAARISDLTGKIITEIGT